MLIGLCVGLVVGALAIVGVHYFNCSFKLPKKCA